MLCRLELYPRPCVFSVLDSIQVVHAADLHSVDEAVLRFKMCRSSVRSRARYGLTRIASGQLE
eukprot:scaffold254536_cov12-Tisochrysis_lutea.AAC.1